MAGADPDSGMRIDEIAARTQDWLAGRDPTVTGLPPETDPAIAAKGRASLVR